MSFHLNYYGQKRPNPVQEWRRRERGRRLERYAVLGIAVIGTLAGALLIGLGLPLLRALF